MLLLLCITQQQQGQLQDSYKLIMKSLLSNIKRPTVKEISFTATWSGMADIYIYDEWEPIRNSQLIGKYKEKSVLPR